VKKRKIRAITAFKAIQGHRGRKPVCDFLLVINSNWHSMSYRFGVIAAYCSILDTCVFEPPFAGLRDNVRCSSWAHWKARMDLILVLIELFFARCYRWGATSEYRFKIGDYAPRGAIWPKISGREGRPHQPFFFSEI